MMNTLSKDLVALYHEFLNGDEVHLDARITELKSFTDSSTKEAQVLESSMVAFMDAQMRLRCWGRRGGCLR